MSTSDKLATAVGAKTPAVHSSGNAVIDTIKASNFKAQIALALPKHMTADRMARVVLTEIRKNPVLANCEIKSFMGAVMQASQLGLEPGSALGQCYLLPYKNNKAGRIDAQLIIGYKGMIDLARRSGQILSINAYVVKDGDDFFYQLGLKPDIHHIPAPTADRLDKPTTYVYAVANLKGGGTQFEVLSRAEIERIRNESANYKFAKPEYKESTIWGKYFDDMAKKTAIRRLFKYLPVSIEALRIADEDAKREAGIEIDPLDNPDNINIDTFKVEDAEIISEEGADNGISK